MTSLIKLPNQPNKVSLGHMIHYDIITGGPIPEGYREDVSVSLTG